MYSHTQPTKEHSKHSHSTQQATLTLQLTDLVVDGVKLGEDDAVDEAWLGVVGVVGQRLVELGQLVHRLVAHQRLPHKQDAVRLVDLDQLGQGAHQRLVVLHAPGRVHQAGVEAAVTRCRTANALMIYLFLASSPVNSAQGHLRAFHKFKFRTQIEYSTKHAHYTHAKHTNVIRKLAPSVSLS